MKAFAFQFDIKK